MKSGALEGFFRAHSSPSPTNPQVFCSIHYLSHPSISHYIQEPSSSPALTEALAVQGCFYNKPTEVYGDRFRGMRMPISHHLPACLPTYPFICLPTHPFTCLTTTQLSDWMRKLKCTAVNVPVKLSRKPNLVFFF